MEALAYLLELDSWRDALKIAHKYTTEGLEAYRVRAEARARKDPLPRAAAQLYYQQAQKFRPVRGALYAPAEWYLKRGISAETQEQFLLGHDGTRFTIPVFGSQGELLNIRYRKDEAYCTEEDYTADEKLRKKYSGVPGRNGTYLYPEWIIAQDNRDWIVIVEGELDAVRLHQAGYPAATTTNGAGNLKLTLRSLKSYDRIKTVYIASDIDEAGEYAARELFSLAIDHGYRVQRVSWPREWGKDVTELYNSGHTFRQALSSR